MKQKTNSLKKEKKYNEYIEDIIKRVLNYTLCTFENIFNSLHDDYSDKDKVKFISNLTMFTINELIEIGIKHDEQSNTEILMKIFDENLKLKTFDYEKFKSYSGINNNVIFLVKIIEKLDEFLLDENGKFNNEFLNFIFYYINIVKYDIDNIEYLTNLKKLQKKKMNFMNMPNETLFKTTSAF